MHAELSGKMIPFLPLPVGRPKEKIRSERQPFTEEERFINDVRNSRATDEQEYLLHFHSTETLLVYLLQAAVFNLFHEKKQRLSFLPRIFAADFGNLNSVETLQALFTKHEDLLESSSKYLESGITLFDHRPDVQKVVIAAVQSVPAPGDNSAEVTLENARRAYSGQKAPRALLRTVLERLWPESPQDALAKALEDLKDAARSVGLSVEGFGGEAHILRLSFLSHDDFKSAVYSCEPGGAGMDWPSKYPLSNDGHEQFRMLARPELFITRRVTCTSYSMHPYDDKRLSEAVASVVDDLQKSNALRVWIGK